MSTLNESDIEKLTLELLKQQGYQYLSLEEQETERQNSSDVVLQRRLKAAISKLNPKLPHEIAEQALGEVLELSPSQMQGLVQSNKSFYQMLIEGVPVEYQRKE